MLLIVAEYGGKICTSEESAASKIFDLNSTAEQLPYAWKYTLKINQSYPFYSYSGK